MLTSICCINQTRSVSHTEFIRVVAAINDQVRRDFAPFWQKYAVVFAAQDASKVSKSAWKVIVKDQPSTGENGFLGEHDVTSLNTPEGEVLAEFSEQQGTPWSSVLSHEVLEILGDEWINLYVLHNSQLWYREMCDAVQEDNYSDPNGVVLSNFVLPNYFTESTTGPFDFKHLIKKPFEVRPGGYAGFLQIDSKGVLTPQQVFGESFPEWRKRESVRKQARKRNAVNLITSNLPVITMEEEVKEELK